jgi:hypothetical protein
MLRLLMFALMAALPLMAAAEIYKYVDSDGVIRYTDQPPSKDARPVELPPLQTYTGPDYAPVDEDAGEVGRDSILLPRPTSGGGYVGIELVSPAANQVFNNANPVITASALVNPELQPGDRVVFLVDGLPYPAPAGLTSVALTELERGSHTIQAVVMDSQENIQIQSETVDFQFNQPSTLRPAPINSLPKPP